MIILQTVNLTKRYGELAIVDSVNLNVRAGDRHAVIGANGAGKSSLFHLITGKLSPTAGIVNFKDQCITGMRSHQIVRMGLSRSFQITNIFKELTARENLRLAFQASQPYNNIWASAVTMKKTADRTSQLLETLQLQAVADQIAGTLSYGDQRRLEIGLALACDPELLLLDEPIAGMSQAASFEIVDLLMKIPRSISVLLIEHNLDVVLKLSDRITVLHRGQIIADGTPDEVQKDQQVQAAYLGDYIAPEL